jgi:hypothetical protein
MLNQRALLLLAALCVLCGTQLAAAAEVHFVEAVDGDLANSGALPILAFDVGVNTVSGRLGEQAALPVDFDGFAFSIPAGTQLVAGQVEMFEVAGVAIADWNLRVGSNTVGVGTFLEVVDPDTPGIDAIDSVPLGPDVYTLGQRIFIGGPDLPNLADYTFTFQVAIPEPLSATLLLSGAAILLGVRWRNAGKGGTLIS